MRRLLVALVLFVVAASCTDPPTTGDIDDGTPGLLEGRIQAFEGMPVVVNYWATWCDPCREEMPFIVDAAKDFDGEVAFLGVNVQDNAEAADAFAKEYEMPFSSIADPEKDIANSQRLAGLPATQFYDADGELAFVKQGPIEEDELLDKIDDVLAASSS